MIQTNDEARRVEIEELRKELEQERFERRDQINKLRYEFEEFVHRKIDKVLEEIEEMKRTEKRDDSSQQQQIDGLISDLDHLKNTCDVTSSPRKGCGEWDARDRINVTCLTGATHLRIPSPL